MVGITWIWCLGTLPHHCLYQLWVKSFLSFMSRNIRGLLWLISTNCFSLRSRPFTCNCQRIFRTNISSPMTSYVINLNWLLQRETARLISSPFKHLWWNLMQNYLMSKSHWTSLKSVSVNNRWLVQLDTDHWVKSVRVWIFSGPYFSVFGLNTERCSYLSVFSPNLGKYRPEKPRLQALFTEWIV